MTLVTNDIHFVTRYPAVEGFVCSIVAIVCMGL